MINKAEIATYVGANNGLSKKASLQIVDDVFQLIGNTLSNGEEVNIKEFGKFALKTREARVGRNPKTGETIEIAARRGVLFKPAKALKEQVQYQ